MTNKKLIIDEIKKKLMSKIISNKININKKNKDQI
jgi:hypothetical protein